MARRGSTAHNFRHGGRFRGGGHLKRIPFFRAMVATLILVEAAAAAPVRLRTEYLENPPGIDMPTPHLSWQSDGSERNWKQTAYQVLVASRAELLSPGRADVWDSGKIDSDESVGIAYHGPPLESRHRYFWKV